MVRKASFEFRNLYAIRLRALCDTHDRGALDVTDFIIAMYLIQASMTGQLSSVPTSLPPGLYEQAGGAVSSHGTGGSMNISSPGFPQVPRHTTLQPQLTGQASRAPPLPNRRLGHSGLAPTIPPFPGVAPQTTGQWDVTPAEKASADQFFDTLDTKHRGYIEGDVAVPFMLQSKLPEDVLAQVWSVFIHCSLSSLILVYRDLADINNDGRLTRDGFAVALHLIQSNLSGKEIPSSLPPTLVPPSMRAGPFTVTPAPPKPQEPIRDLLWDDSPPPSATTPSNNPTHVLQPQTTGNRLSASTAPRSAPFPQDPFGSSATASRAFLSAFDLDIG